MEVHEIIGFVIAVAIVLPIALWTVYQVHSRCTHCMTKTMVQHKEHPNMRVCSVCKRVRIDGGD